MFNYNYGMNPYQGFNQQSIIRVNGMDGAKAYQMSNNSTVALFDGNDDVFYVKTTDGAGFPTIRTFRFTEVKEVQPVDTNEYISREEFEMFRQEVINNGKQFIPQSESTGKQKSNK